MFGNMITREDIRLLKLRKKKKMQRMAAAFFSLFAIAVIGIFIITYKLNNSQTNPEALGMDVSISVQPDLGDGYAGLINATATDAKDYYEAYASDPEYAGQSYTVPETDLMDIHEVVGNNWANEELFEKNPSDPIGLGYFNDAVFIGDSRTEGLILFSDLININGIAYKGLNVAKLDNEPCISVPGYEGQYTCFEAIQMTDYDYYYCMFGINELGWDSVDSFIICFGQLLDCIFESNPDAIVYVESVLPVTKKLSDENDIFKQERVLEFNEKLLELCQTRGDVIYLDIAAAVVDEDGYLPDNASPDGIHLGYAYCKRVIEYIRCNTYYLK